MNNDRKWKYGHEIMIHILVSAGVYVGVQKRQRTSVGSCHLRQLLHIPLVEMNLESGVKDSRVEPSVKLAAIRSDSTSWV